MSKTIKDVLGQISRSVGRGDISQAALNTLYGINHRGYGNPVPNNKDNVGLTFFTRPNLNLTYDNISPMRVLTPLLDGNGGGVNTLQRAIRMLLDPYLGSPAKFDDPTLGGSGIPMACPLIDQDSAFIPLLSNNLISLSGWPDVGVETFTSTPGLFQESWSMVDSHSRFFETFELNATFKNIEGDPISLLFFVWLHYMSSVYQGVMVPYPENIVERRIDYQTRIYRLILDHKRQYVQKIACCGAAFPLNSPLGNAFNFTNEGVYIGDNDQLNIRFKAMGADYNDPIIISEFNAVVAIFNGKMKGKASDRERYYRKVSTDELDYFNYRGYPYIDQETHELEWWVPKELYAEYENRFSFGVESLISDKYSEIDPLKM